MQKICGNCTHWQFQAFRDMGKLGYGTCSLGKSFTWLAPQMSCAKHEKAHPQVLVTRRAEYGKR